MCQFVCDDFKNMKITNEIQNKSPLINKINSIEHPLIFKFLFSLSFCPLCFIIPHHTAIFNNKY